MTTRLWGSTEVAEQLRDVHPVNVPETGRQTIGPVEITVGSAAHETIYPGVPLPENITYLIDGALFAPGDAFAVPRLPVKVLLLPLGAPWMKIAETIDYLCEVRPQVVVPVHDAGLAAPHRALHLALVRRFAPSGTTVLDPPIGEQIHLDI